MTVRSASAFESDSMTDQQEGQLCRIKQEFLARVDRKYRAGVAEHHGYLGDLSELELIDNTIAEAIDQFCYLYALREKLLSRKDSLNA